MAGDVMRGSPFAKAAVMLTLSSVLCVIACGVVRVDPAPPEACADPPPAPPTRLKTRWRAGEDGSRDRLDGMYDTELDAVCGWVTAADGLERCLPVMDPLAGNGNSYYADEACTQTLVLAPLCDEGAPRFGVAATSSACGIAWTVTGVGAQWDGPVWQFPLGNPCTASVLPKGYGVWLAGEEMAPELFVAGTVAIDP